MSIAKIQSALDSVVSAEEIICIPKHVEVKVGQGEGLSGIVCREYETKNPLAIAALVEIVAAAEQQQGVVNPTNKWLQKGAVLFLPPVSRDTLQETIQQLQHAKKAPAAPKTATVTPQSQQKNLYEEKVIGRVGSHTLRDPGSRSLYNNVSVYYCGDQPCGAAVRIESWSAFRTFVAKQIRNEHGKDLFERLDLFNSATFLLSPDGERSILASALCQDEAGKRSQATFAIPQQARSTLERTVIYPDPENPTMEIVETATFEIPNDVEGIPVRDAFEEVASLALSWVLTTTDDPSIQRVANDAKQIWSRAWEITPPDSSLALVD